jgi:hypothetical protein
MAIKSEIEFQITSLNELYDEFIAYNDSVSFTDYNQLKYVTSDTLLFNTKKCFQTAIQQLEQDKQLSLTEYVYTTKIDTTLINICYEVYGIVNDTNIDNLIEANDLMCLNRNDINPNSPIIKKNTRIVYYK